MTNTVTNENFNIVGMLINSSIEKQPEVEAALAKIKGVELHAADKGKLILTIDDSESELPLVETMNQLDRIPGVQSTAIAYHHFEDDFAQQEKPA